MTPRRITTLCSKLVVWTSDNIPGQRKVYEAAVSARIPAFQVNGIWHFHEEDRDAILAGLGLRPKATQLGHTPHACAVEQVSAA